MHPLRRPAELPSDDELLQSEELRRLARGALAFAQRQASQRSLHNGGPPIGPPIGPPSGPPGKARRATRPEDVRMRTGPTQPACPPPPHLFDRQPNLVMSRKMASPGASPGEVSGFPHDVPREIFIREPLSEALEGLPQRALVLSLSRDGLRTHSYVHRVLKALLGEADRNIVYLDERDVPEVAACLGTEDFSVTVCADFGVWAVGVGANRTARTLAPKVAFAAGLSLQEQDLGGSLDLPDFPVFLDFLELAGKVYKKGGTKKEQEQVAKKRPREPEHERDETRTVLPRNRPFWICLPETDELPEELDGFPFNALVVSSDAKGGAIYSQADKMLESILGENAEDHIVLYDDFNWERFPQIGAQLKRIATVEECMTVALCASHSIWAVGVAMKGKSRFAAARAALAAALAVDAVEAGEEVCFDDAPRFERFVDEARQELARCIVD